MLQRKQTLWMLLAAACAVLTLKFSFSTGPSAADGKIIEYVTATSNIFLMIMTVALVVATLVNVFNYKNRVLQLRITVMLIVISLLDIYLFYWQTNKKFINSTYSLGSILALVIPVALIFAARGIFKDQKLVKSVDRLR